MENTKRLDRRMVAGLLLVFAGSLLLLDTIGLFDFNLSRYIFNWKSILIFIGLFALTRNGNQSTGWILIGLGVLFWIPELFDYRLGLRDILWPAVLIGLGLILLTRNDRRFKKNLETVGEGLRNNFRGRNSDESFFNETAIFGGGNVRFSSKTFRGGKLTNIFGGSDINLLNTQPVAGDCTIDALVIFGGAKLIVPDDWQVKTEAVSIFGGVSDERVLPTQYNPDKTLTIKGTIIFGGIEIKSY